MMNPPYAGGLQPVYQKDSSWARALQDHKQKVFACCRDHQNRRVRIQTINGQVYDGMIVNVDETYAYIASDSGGHRPVYPVPFPGVYPPYSPYAYPYPSPAASAILPLVLYELLVISLL